MIFSDVLRLASRNLVQARLRTALTTLGVSIGIASLAGMLSLGIGLQEQFSDRFIRSGMFDAMTVFPASPARGARGRAAGRVPGILPGDPSAPRVPLDDDALRRIESVENVREVYPNMRIPVEIRYGRHSEMASATGVPPSADGTGIFQKMSHGSFFSPGSEEGCILSLDLAARLDAAEPGELIGRTLTLVYASPSPTQEAGGFQVRRSEAEFNIVGIVEREQGPGFGGSLFSPVMIPLARAREMGPLLDSFSPQGFLRQLEGKPSFASATVKVRRPQDLEDVEKQVREMGFNVFSVSDAFQGMKRAFIILDIILGLVGSIALAVASLGIVNTMVMSILERTRDIGIMKAIGGSDGQIRRIFLVEASVIGSLGGLFGIALGWLVSRVINFGANLYIESQGGTSGNLFTFPWWLLLGALGFSILISLLAGSYPAGRAARLDPVQALRHD